MSFKNSLRVVLPFAAAVALVGCGASEADWMMDVDPGPGEVNPSATEAAVEQGLTQMPPCHTPLATFDGTTAFSNANSAGSGISCGGGGEYGLKYQCVELVMRHFKTKWNLRWWGNARDLLNNAPRKDVDVYKNGDVAHPPVPGDMLVWEKSTYGHVALVTKVTATTVEIIEQNVVGDGTAVLPYENGRIGVRWGNWAATGWAHAKANTAPSTAPVETPAVTPPVPPAPAPINWACSRSAFKGGQLWTCNADALYRCESGKPVKQACSSGCSIQPLGKNDFCR